MSVPESWTVAAPSGIKTLASVIPTNFAALPEASLTGEGGAFSQMALSSLAGRAMTTSSFVSHAAAAGHVPRRSVAEADPAAATIIVIPAIED